jgi:hypothetical protein
MTADARFKNLDDENTRGVTIEIDIIDEESRSNVDQSFTTTTASHTKVSSN